MSGVEYLPGQPGREPYTPPPPTVPPPGEPGPSAPPTDDPPAVDDELLDDRPPARRHLGPRSLTARLVIGVVSLVVVLVTLIGVGTYFALNSYLDDQLDQQLQTTINQGGNRIFSNPVEQGPVALKIYAVGLDPNTAEVLAAPPNISVIGPIRLTGPDRTRLAQRDTIDPITIRTTDGQELRVTVRPGTVFGNPATIVIGLSTQPERQTLHRLVFLEALIGGAAVVIALLATMSGVRFSLRRLREVTNTAQDVAAELSPEGAGLDRRVPVTEKDTEVGQLAESMNTLLGAVETQFAARLESEQRMRQFLADASHELRTPLTSIRGYAELARMQRAVGNPEEDNLSRIESEGTRMSRLIEDLLMLARGDGADRTVRTELIDVDDLLDDSVRGVRAAYPDRAIDIELDAVPQVIGDRDQLIRVVRNLVTNAAVHTRPERPILVRGSTVDDGVAIQVVDGGPGLAPEDAAHVFERFWRADKARTRARGGSGLGLSIVASIVRAHGGTVRFDSSVEGGSTVTVWLPGVQPG